jgi:hypothetical protein
MLDSQQLEIESNSVRLKLACRHCWPYKFADNSLTLLLRICCTQRAPTSLFAFESATCSASQDKYVPRKQGETNRRTSDAVVLAKRASRLHLSFSNGSISGFRIILKYGNAGRPLEIDGVAAHCAPGNDHFRYSMLVIVGAPRSRWIKTLSELASHDSTGGRQQMHRNDNPALRDGRNRGRSAVLISKRGDSVRTHGNAPALKIGCMVRSTLHYKGVLTWSRRNTTIGKVRMQLKKFKHLFHERISSLVHILYQRGRWLEEL